MKKIQISPSILSADFSRLGKDIKRLENGGADLIHVDVMDGHFVPNLTIGPPVIRALRKYTKLPFDVHLMISPVHKYIKSYAQAGADIITIHHEIDENIHECINFIKSYEKKVGISIKPKTPANVLEQYMDKIDLILIMTVEPGFGGQKFMSDQVEKIKQIKEMIGQKDIEIEVDGGINLENAHDVKEAGANVLVSGSTIFNCTDYKSIINKLRSV